MWMAQSIANWTGLRTEGRKQGWPEEFLRKNLETTEAQRQAFTQAVPRMPPRAT